MWKVGGGRKSWSCSTSWLCLQYKNNNNNNCRKYCRNRDYLSSLILSDNNFNIKSSSSCDYSNSTRHQCSRVDVSDDNKYKCGQLLQPKLNLCESYEKNQRQTVPFNYSRNLCKNYTKLNFSQCRQFKTFSANSFQFQFEFNADRNFCGSSTVSNSKDKRNRMKCQTLFNESRLFSTSVNFTSHLTCSLNRSVNNKVVGRQVNFNSRTQSSLWGPNLGLVDGGQNSRGFASFFPIPGTSAAAAAAGLVEGTVVERQIYIENETFRREELRSGNFRRRSGPEPSMVALGASFPPAGVSARSRISSKEIASVAEDFLGSERFSTRSSLSHNFGPFQDIISLFLFKVAHIDHPLLYVTKIIEAEPSQTLREDRENPYPLWRAMMVLLTAEMYGFPRDISLAPPEIHWAIKDKHNRVSKISEIAWITHQLHRRVLDISSISPSRLSSLYPPKKPGQVKLTHEEQMKLLGNLHKANKATTLVGDLLLTQKCAHLAALKSPPVTELICNSLADFCESEFELGLKSGQPRHFNYESWLSRCELGLGSLLGHSMYSALLFSGFDTATRNHAFKLGSLLGILYQAYDDISFFNRDELTEPSWMDIGNLPSVYQIQRNPELLLKSHADIFHAVKSSRFAMEESLETFQYLKDHALKALSEFEDVENTTARDILINFVHSLSPVQPTSI